MLIHYQQTHTKGRPRHQLVSYNGKLQTLLIDFLVFVYTCPAASPFKEKPVYAACRSSVVSAAKSLGMKIDREVSRQCNLPFT